VLLRHGESASNAAGEFTGWADVPLSTVGEEQARIAGTLLRQAGIGPDVVHTSVLTRTIRTAEIVLGELDRDGVPARRSWRLNERQYGALAGRNKAQVRAEVGLRQYQSWRRSFGEKPPPMRADMLRALRADPRYAGLPAGTVPDCESLADVLARVLPYWIGVIIPDLRAGHTPLVVAHGNSLRALAMHLDDLSEREVEELNIPTGIPLCYDLDEELQPSRRGGRYLDPDAASQASAAVAREGS
jgi:2,3-bisphosphoglycerate-dependent phosphoglycerate mutase